jgi:hypothetical protein
MEATRHLNSLRKELLGKDKLNSERFDTKAFDCGKIGYSCITLFTLYILNSPPPQKKLFFPELIQEYATKNFLR